MKINFFNIIRDCLEWNIKTMCHLLLFAFMISIVSGFLIENTSLLQVIRAQNGNFINNNDSSPAKTITQGVLNQIDKAFSNTPLGSGNVPTQQSNNNNNVPTQQSVLQ